MRGKQKKSFRGRRIVMRKAKKIRVGSVIQFPHYQFAPMRRGWNGWIFRAGIVEKIYTSKSGRKCAVVRYCTRIAARYQMLPNVEATKSICLEHMFEYDIKHAQKEYERLRNFEKGGEEVCWSEDTALLVNHGLIDC